MKLRREFSSEVESAHAALRILSAIPSSGNADLTGLFRIASHEAKKSRAQNRILRVVSSASLHFYLPFRVFVYYLYANAVMQICYLPTETDYPILYWTLKFYLLIAKA